MNLLNEGREVLVTIYNEVKELEDKIKKEKELSNLEESTEKALVDKEKSVSDEIMDTLKVKRNGIMKTFDEEENKLNRLLKKVNQKKEKYREGKVSERIKAETEEYIEDNKMIKAEAKKQFKQTKTPGFFNTGFFYTLFMPRGIKDLLICLFTFIVIFAGIPFLIWLFMEKPVEIYIIAIIYLVLIFVFGVLYITIFKASRKYPMVNKGNNFRQKIKNNKKLIAKITKNIKKDKDDTQYGLEHYDAQLEEMTAQREELNEKRKSAIKTFDEVTKQAIASEIQNASQPEIDSYKEKLGEITKELSGIREHIKKLKIKIVEEYEPFLGYVNMTTISEMLKIESGSTVGEVLDNYKKLNTDKSET